MGMPRHCGEASKLQVAMKGYLALLTWLMLLVPARGQDAVPLGWTPRNGPEKWLLQQRWESRVAHTTMAFTNGMEEYGQVLWVKGDSIWWQPTYGPGSLGQPARWVRPSQLNRVEYSRDPDLLLTGTRTLAATVYGFYVLNWSMTHAYYAQPLPPEAGIVWGGMLGTVLGLTFAGIKALNLSMPRKWNRQEGRWDEAGMLKNLGRVSVYRAGGRDRPPFWELWPQRYRLQAQLETGHIMYDRRVIQTSFNLSSSLGSGNYPTTRFHNLSLGYGLDDFTQAGIRVSAPVTYDHWRALHPHLNGRVGYKLTRGAQWGAWISRDLIPYDSPHLLRSFLQIGAGAYWQRITLDQFVEIQSYEPSYRVVVPWDVLEEREARLRATGVELFARAGYRIHPNVSLVATVRRQWGNRSGRIERLYFDLPPHPEYSYAELNLGVNRDDFRATIITTGLKIRL